MKILITIPASHEHVRLVGKALKGILEDIIEEGDTLFLMELAACEAVTNSIKHAYANQQQGNVEMDIEINNSQIIIKVADEGKKLNPELLKRHSFQDTCDLASLNEGGRGIPIINNVMDQVDYYSECNKNILIMKKSITIRNE